MRELHGDALQQFPRTLLREYSRGSGTYRRSRHALLALPADLRKLRKKQLRTRQGRRRSLLDLGRCLQLCCSLKPTEEQVLQAALLLPGAGSYVIYSALCGNSCQVEQEPRIRVYLDAVGVLA